MTAPSKQAKKSGPVARFGPTEKFTTNLPAKHRLVLEARSEQKQISLVAALREAIDLLEVQMDAEAGVKA